MLTPVIAIITGPIVFSLVFVYVSTSANMNNSINVSIIDIISPFKILTELLFCTIALASEISFMYIIPTFLKINWVLLILIYS